MRCGAGKTARVGLQGKVGGLKQGEAAVLLPVREGETGNSPAAYVAPLRQALIDTSTGTQCMLRRPAWRLESTWDSDL